MMNTAERDYVRLSAGAEVAIALGVCVFICAVILVYLLNFGPIFGGNGPASHAGAGLGEIATIIFLIGLFTCGIITRLVYRARPIRWIKLVSIVYLILLVFWIGVGFIVDPAVVFFMAIQLVVGVVASILLGLSYLVSRMWS